MFSWLLPQLGFYVLFIIITACGVGFFSQIVLKKDVSVTSAVLVRLINNSLGFLVFLFFSLLILQAGVRVEELFGDSMTPFLDRFCSFDNFKIIRVLSDADKELFIKIHSSRYNLIIEPGSAEFQAATSESSFADIDSYLLQVSQDRENSFYIFFLSKKFCSTIDGASYFTEAFKYLCYYAYVALVYYYITYFWYYCLLFICSRYLLCLKKLHKIVVP